MFEVTKNKKLCRNIQKSFYKQIGCRQSATAMVKIKELTRDSCSPMKGLRFFDEESERFFVEESERFFDEASEIFFFIR